MSKAILTVLNFMWEGSVSFLMSVFSRFSVRDTYYLYNQDLTAPHADGAKDIQVPHTIS